jgi:hypothetical protein
LTGVPPENYHFKLLQKNAKTRFGVLLRIFCRALVVPQEDANEARLFFGATGRRRK